MSQCCGLSDRPLMVASAQVVEMSVNTNNSPSQDYTTNPDDHSNHNKKFCNTYDVIDLNYILLYRLKLRKYIFVTVHFLFRSDEKLTVNENNIILESTLSIIRCHGNETHHIPQILIKM